MLISPFSLFNRIDCNHLGQIIIFPGCFSWKSLVLCCLLSACTQSSDSVVTGLSLSRERSVSKEEVRLGEHLFFDKMLSKDNSVSCATCHIPEQGFGDRKDFSIGVSGLPMARHTPHLYNLGSNRSFFWDGRAASLEQQALMPIADQNEMGLTHRKMIQRLKGSSTYQTLFGAAYSGQSINKRAVGRAIAAYVRTIVADDTPFDRYKGGDESALSVAALRGMEVFFGKNANCSKCHSGPNFTDGDFHNTGLIGDDMGRANIDRVGNFRMRPYPFFQTQKAFKTPGLRNIALTSPYMHNGVFSNLREVIQNYNLGSQDPDSYGISIDIKPLGLSEREVADLVTFLEQGLTSPHRYYTPVDALTSK